MAARRTRLAIPMAWALLAACLALGQAAAPDAEEWPATVAQTAGHAVVTVIASTDDQKQTSQGSGFLVSADGLVVTNYHVIKGMTGAVVTLDNGSLLPVDGVLRKTLSLTQQDLVVLKCSGRRLPFLELAPDDSVRTGQAVAAMGTPMGLEATLSTGVVSAVRDFGNGTTVLQTTAPISHGSSGGPLLRRDGKVVGVTSAFLSEGQNLNFAVAVGPLRALLAGLDDAAKEDAVALGDVQRALAGGASAGGGDETVNAAWVAPSSGLDVARRLLALWGPSVYAGSEGQPGLALLASVKVLVEDLPSAAKASGLTESYLQSYVELAIRRSGAVELADVKPYVYVGVNCVDAGGGWVAFDLTLQLCRPALLMTPSTLDAEGKPVYAAATVWERGVIGHCESTDLQWNVTRKLDSWLPDLLNDIRRANPRNAKPSQD